MRYIVVLITIQIICLPAFAQQTYPNIEGKTLYDDERVIVQQFKLEPGIWEGIHEHPEHQLVIVLSSTDELRYRFRGKERVFTESGDQEDDNYNVFWRPGPVSMEDQHESGNTGTRNLEWIAITFKSDSLSIEEPLIQFTEQADQE